MYKKTMSFTEVSHVRKLNYKKKKHAKHLALSTKKLIFAFECSLTQ